MISSRGSRDWKHQSCTPCILCIGVASESRLVEPAIRVAYHVARLLVTRVVFVSTWKGGKKFRASEATSHTPTLEVWLHGVGDRFTLQLDNYWISKFVSKLGNMVSYSSLFHRIFQTFSSFCIEHSVLWVYFFIVNNLLGGSQFSKVIGNYQAFGNEIWNDQCSLTLWLPRGSHMIHGFSCDTTVVIGDRSASTSYNCKNLIIDSFLTIVLLTIVFLTICFIDN